MYGAHAWQFFLALTRSEQLERCKNRACLMKTNTFYRDLQAIPVTRINLLKSLTTCRVRFNVLFCLMMGEPTEYLFIVNAQF